MRPEAEAPLVAADEVGVVLRHPAVVDGLLAARVADTLDRQPVDSGFRPDLWRGRLVTHPREGLVELVAMQIAGNQLIRAVQLGVDVEPFVADRRRLAVVPAVEIVAR
jgi:hypothetical protein